MYLDRYFFSYPKKIQHMIFFYLVFLFFLAVVVVDGKFIFLFFPLVIFIFDREKRRRAENLINLRRKNILKIYSILQRSSFFLKSFMFIFTRKFFKAIWKNFIFTFSRIEIKRREKRKQESEEIVIFFTRLFCNPNPILKLCVIESNESTDKRKSHWFSLKRNHFGFSLYFFSLFFSF